MKLYFKQLEEVRSGATGGKEAPKKGGGVAGDTPQHPSTPPPPQAHYLALIHQRGSQAVHHPSTTHLRYPPVPSAAAEAPAGGPPKLGRYQMTDSFISGHTQMLAAAARSPPRPPNLLLLLLSSASVPPTATWLRCAPPTGGRPPLLLLATAQTEKSYDTEGPTRVNA
ncbi:hypothetical protein Q5P01_018281 [Channa striata]|uniref:Uncharacterized protein n=1 Tax=Channa striata TaxID=64152 RepID=A0AA88M443_CHASR|nr:hypothetical protein Q5P01_018281 [Channa striata]